MKHKSGFGPQKLARSLSWIFTKTFCAGPAAAGCTGIADKVSASAAAASVTRLDFMDTMLLISI
jgi:hypothetical protein